MQINQYPVTASSITPGSYIDADIEIMPGVWQSQKVPPALFNAFSSNISNSDLTQTDTNRTYFQDHSVFTWDQVKEFYMFADTSPTGGASNFNFSSSLTGSSQRVMNIASGVGDVVQIYGDGQQRNFGNFTIDGRLIIGYDQASLAPSIWGHTFAAPSGSARAFTVGTTGLSVSLMNINSNGEWMMGYLSGPTHSMGRNADNHYIFNSNGAGLLVGADNDACQASSIVEIRSTTRGFMLPKMTRAQRIAIPLFPSSEGIMVYQTDTVGDDKKGYWGYNVNGAGWERFAMTSEI